MRTNPLTYGVNILILIANLIDHNEKDDSMHILSECIAGSKEKHLRA